MLHHSESKDGVLSYGHVTDRCMCAYQTPALLAKAPIKLKFSTEPKEEMCPVYHHYLEGGAGFTLTSTTVAKRSR